MERATTFEVRGDVWLYPGDAGWHFLTLPLDVADEIRARPDRRTVARRPADL